MKIAILTGPTATGKTALALELAATHPSIEIINADSMLVYREMDIGTAKPAAGELKRVPHHLIDVRSPDEAFTAGDFVRAAQEAIEGIVARGKRPLFVGGTGFYLKALMHGLWDAPPTDAALRARLEQDGDESLYRRLMARDPPAAARIGPNDRYRLIRAHEILALTGKTVTELEKSERKEPDPRFELWVVDRDSKELYSRIEERARQMLEAGLIDEVESLRSKYPRSRALKAVGYTQVCDYLEGRAPDGRKIKPGIDGLREEIILATRQLVKRQRTWFRGQKKAKWFRLPEDADKLKQELRSLYA